MFPEAAAHALPLDCALQSPTPSRLLAFRHGVHAAATDGVKEVAAGVVKVLGSRVAAGIAEERVHAAIGENLPAFFFLGQRHLRGSVLRSERPPGEGQ